MRLSEAIRLGAMMGPQAFGSYGHICSPGVIARCALGGAVAAAGVGPLTKLSQTFPILAAVVHPHPVSGTFDGVHGIIESLNDDHRWSRERIADWVQTIEPPVAVEDEEEVPEADVALVAA